MLLAQTDGAFASSVLPSQVIEKMLAEDDPEATHAIKDACGPAYSAQRTSELQAGDAAVSWTLLAANNLQIVHADGTSTAVGLDDLQFSRQGPTGASRGVYLQDDDMNGDGSGLQSSKRPNRVTTRSGREPNGIVLSSGIGGPGLPESITAPAERPYAGSQPKSGLSSKVASYEEGLVQVMRESTEPRLSAPGPLLTRGSSAGELVSVLTAGAGEGTWHGEVEAAVAAVSLHTTPPEGTADVLQQQACLDDSEGRGSEGEDERASNGGEEEGASEDDEEMEEAIVQGASGSSVSSLAGIGLSQRDVMALATYHEQTTIMFADIKGWVAVHAHWYCGHANLLLHDWYDNWMVTQFRPCCTLGRVPWSDIGAK